MTTRPYDAQSPTHPYYSYEQEDALRVIFCPIFVNSSVMAAGPRATASVLLFGMKRMPYESLGSVFCNVVVLACSAWVAICP